MPASLKRRQMTNDSLVLCLICPMRSIVGMGKAVVCRIIRLAYIDD